MSHLNTEDRRVKNPTKIAKIWLKGLFLLPKMLPLNTAEMYGRLFYVVHKYWCPITITCILFCRQCSSAWTCSFINLLYQSLGLIGFFFFMLNPPFQWNNCKQLIEERSFPFDRAVNLESQNFRCAPHPLTHEICLIFTSARHHRRLQPNP